MKQPTITGVNPGGNSKLKKVFAGFLLSVIMFLLAGCGWQTNLKEATAATDTIRADTCAVLSTPTQDGFHMPAEWEKQEQIWMAWPYRTDTWRDGAKPAQKAYAEVAKAIAAFEPVTVCAPKECYESAKEMLRGEKNIRVVEMSSDDAWMRDMGPTFLVGNDGSVRAVDWDFNAWGGLYDGLYFPWDQDALVARKVCDLEHITYYRTEGFVLEGGSISVDGEGTVMTTESCLLSKGRNPNMTKQQIEEMLLCYLGAKKVIWLPEGIDPKETNGHVDEVACFTAPGEVAMIWTDDMKSP